MIDKFGMELQKKVIDKLSMKFEIRKAEIESGKVLITKYDTEESLKDSLL